MKTTLYIIFIIIMLTKVITTAILNKNSSFTKYIHNLANLSYKFFIGLILIEILTITE